MLRWRSHAHVRVGMAPGVKSLNHANLRLLSLRFLPHPCQTDGALHGDYATRSQARFLRYQSMDRSRPSRNGTMGSKPSSFLAAAMSASECLMSPARGGT